MLHCHKAHAKIDRQIENSAPFKIVTAQNLCYLCYFLSLFLIVSANEIDCLERLISEMTY